MTQQLVLEVSDVSILPSLRKILSSIAGVTVKRTPRKPRYSELVSPSGDRWFDNPKNIEAIRRGEEDIKAGRCREVSLDEIKEMLGL